MAIDYNKARSWSIDRLKYEIETRREDIKDLNQEEAELWEEYNSYPERWGGSYPIGLDTIPVEIEELKDEIESLERIIKSRL